MIIGEFSLGETLRDSFFFRCDNIRVGGQRLAKTET